MSRTSPATGVLSFEEASEVVHHYCQSLRPPATELIALLHALDRVLAMPILADRDFPPFPRATRDGYAARSADLKIIPATLRVVGQIKAGGNFDHALNAGEAV